MPIQFPELIGILLRELPLQLADIYAAVAQGDAEKLYRTAHKLKSGSSSIGALQLAELARRLEAIGYSGDLAGCAPLLEQMPLTAAQTQADFAALLPAY